MLSNGSSQTLNTDHQKIKMYINEKKELYENMIIFLEDSEKNENDMPNIFGFILNEENEDTKNELEIFLELIVHIANNHHRNENFFIKIFKIIQQIKDKIIQYFSNIEIYKIFQNNKKILLFLFQNQIILVDDIIYQNIIFQNEPNGNRYCHFFYPEIKEFDKNDKIKEELLLIDPNIFDRYEEKREEGENDTYICSLIRKDLVEEFVSYVNRTNMPLKDDVKCSIFETNSFLNEKTPTLIEYSAFFGSIKIFQYLRMNDVETTPSLWLYAIHSNNPEMIHLLESLNVDPPSKKYEKCLIESIKCHHNAFSNYIASTFLAQKREESNDDIIFNQKILKNIIQYHNYDNFPSDFGNKDTFYYLCSFNYKKLVNLFMEINEESIKREINEKILIILF